jgi:hypothetical protein
VHPRRAIAATRQTVDVHDLIRQIDISQILRRGSPAAPLAITRAGSAARIGDI